MNENVKLVEVTNTVFPNTAREKFVTYAQSCTLNPYDNMLAIRLEAAENMSNALKTVKHKAPAAKAILSYFDSIREGNAQPAFLIHNSPSDPKEKLLATPNKLKFGSRPEDIGKDGYVAEISMLAANTLSDETPKQIGDKHGGYPFHNLTPRKKLHYSANKITGSFLPWHNELNWQETNDMHLTLLCIKGGKTPTFVASAQDVYDHLSKRLSSKEMSMLEENRFIFTSAAPSDGINGKSTIRPIVKMQNDRVKSINVNGNSNKMGAADPNDKEAQRVVDKVIMALENIHQGIILKPNDFVSIDNLQNVHTRGPFHKDDLQTGQERQLIRTQAQKDENLIEELSALDL